MKTGGMIRCFTLAGVALLLGIHAVLGLRSIPRLSPTYDEALHLAAGYTYWKTGDYRLNSFAHPPFAEMWAAIPLNVIKPMVPTQHPYWKEVWRHQYPFADLFLYHNRIDAESMLNSGRSMMLVLSLLLGILMFIWARQLAGTAAAFISLAFWCFSPAFLTSGTLVTTDMALCLFYFSTIYFFWRWWKDQKTSGKAPAVDYLLTGLSLGFLLASKYSAGMILGVLALLFALVHKETGKKIPYLWLKITGVLLIAAVVVKLIYQFNPLSIYYWIGFKEILSGVMSGRSSYFMGQHSIKGWWYYFPVVFLLKTPISFLVFFAASLLYWKNYTREKLLFLLVPALAYFLVSCFSKVQIGHRHILLVYPFIIVFAASIFPLIKQRIVRAAVILLLVWNAAGTIAAHPWHISYFNEFIGSRDNGYRYLTDSNVDWGQGLKELGLYLKKEKVTGIYLNYFGTGDPSYYGIRYVPIGFIDNISSPETVNERAGETVDFASQPRILFAISATNLQSTYYADKKVFDWLKEVEPVAIIARSILVYDLSMHPGLHAKLREMLIKT